jgi:hypothetical protein
VAVALLLNLAPTTIPTLAATSIANFRASGVTFSSEFSGVLDATRTLVRSAGFIGQIVETMPAVYVVAIGSNTFGQASAEFIGKAIAPPVQVLRRVVDRELCEVVGGQLVWQDDQQVYIMKADRNIVSVARIDATELRFGTTAVEAQPCATQVVAIPDEPAQVSTTLITVPVTVEDGDVPPATSVSVVDFRSIVYLDNNELEVTPPFSGFRYVILPLSRVPVIGIDYKASGDDFSAIYSFYLNDAKSAQDEVNNALAPIRNALTATAKAGHCTLGIEVFGYASPKPFANGNIESNRFLAEGRRAAVLKSLGFKDGESEAPGLRLVSDLPQGQPAAPFKWTPMFANYDEMHEHLRGWYGAELNAVAEINPPDRESDTTKRLRESIARSVVLAISESDLEGCQGISAPETTVAANKQ